MLTNVYFVNFLVLKKRHFWLSLPIYKRKKKKINCFCNKKYWLNKIRLRINRIRIRGRNCRYEKYCNYVFDY